MQQAHDEPALARPPRPGDGWAWSDRLARWVEPGASLLTGVAPPIHTRFKPGVSDPRQSNGGAISARTRELLRQDERLIDRIAQRWIKDTIKGDNRAREQLLDRLEGKVEQAIRATLETRYVIEEVGTPYVDAPPRTVEIEPVRAPIHSALSDAAPPPSVAPQTAGYDRFTRAGSDNECSVALGDAGVVKAKSDPPGSDPDVGGTLSSGGGPTPDSAPVSDG